jgi:hypothetical protein
MSRERKEESKERREGRERVGKSKGVGKAQRRQESNAGGKKSLRGERKIERKNAYQSRMCRAHMVGGDDKGQRVLQYRVRVFGKCACTVTVRLGRAERMVRQRESKRKRLFATIYYNCELKKLG